MNTQVIVKVGKVVLDIVAKSIVIAAPMINNRAQNKMIKETVAKEVAEQIEAFKNQ